MKKGSTLDKPQTNSSRSPQEQALISKLQQDYDLVVAKTTDQLKNSHSANEYTFNITEKRRLLEQQTIKIMVENAIDDILNMSVLPRVGVTPTINVRVLYDITLGRFTIFLPKADQSQPQPQEQPVS